MKRSLINSEIVRVKAELERFSFSLPRFSNYVLEDWRKVAKAERDYIIEGALGWDVSDLGLGDFYKNGLTLFTLRNGGGGYAEKIMFPKLGQVIPFHFHKVKVEDIINRAGGTLVVEFCDGPEVGALPLKGLRVNVDERLYSMDENRRIALKPGESVRIKSGVLHSFRAEDSDVMAGEVSSLNNDYTDNFFLEEVSRFTHVEEDERPYHLLVSDYADYLGGD